MQQQKKEIVERFSLYDQNWLGITITANAEKQIIKLMQQRPKSKGLQLNIQQSGCAGFTYRLKVAESANDLLENLLFEQKGAKIYVPLNAMPFVDGTEVDYVYEGLNQIFKFNNPKAQHSCGCGESFGV